MSQLIIIGTVNNGDLLSGSEGGGGETEDDFDVTLTTQIVNLNSQTVTLSNA